MYNKNLKIILLFKNLIKTERNDIMNERIILAIMDDMTPYLDLQQNTILTKILNKYLNRTNLEKYSNKANPKALDNNSYLLMFISSKKLEGCSVNTLKYYQATIEKMFSKIKIPIDKITTDDLRAYLGDYKENKSISKTTVDNIRRILSSFFGWLEDEDYIIKNPVRRIKKIKTGRVVKEVLTDENLEILKDNCSEIRDVAMIDLLVSTGIRVGELVNLNIEDINIHERECVVFGKGESEREVYFDGKTKVHLMKYLKSRDDDNPALFVSFKKPHNRLGISGVERRLRELGLKSNIKKVHPHKFRRTLATNAIDKGMPIEQVQRLLGHVRIDTTMQYAMVNQSNVKIAHKKFLS